VTCHAAGWHLVFVAMETHDELRPYLFAIAYRMVGSVAEAEDLVQEEFLRHHETGVEAESPKAYLAAVTTRLAIDHLRSARVRRETYPGEWLPEPLVDDQTVQHAETADSLSLAFLHLLEKLSPVERAVFLLREVFDYPYDEVAAIVGKSEDNCRQILARARRHVDAGRRRFDVSREEREEVARRFLAAWEEGKTEALVELLAPDAVVHGDGGGKAPSVREPLVGPNGWRRRSSAGPAGAPARRPVPPRARQRRPWGRLPRRRRQRGLGERVRDRGRRRHRRAVNPQPGQAPAPLIFGCGGRRELTPVPVT
jgi:RNA polymerase sigma-70 factor (ECF subfamily)